MTSTVEAPINTTPIVAINDI
ncbi:MAG: hypothetical protein JWM76_67, partial [Pseudonocardiales bacterium]|nr:hypothetical protein [Pseudonocardiales bacterium]